MIDSEYRKQIYRLIFSLAAIYNICFGLWASLWPRSFFDSFKMAPLNYPGLWQCLGMVLGLYGLLYAYAAWHLDRAGPIIGVGLAGKILGPIGWLVTTHSGEWPVRTFTLIVFNDFVWWLPFALFLLEGTSLAGRLRRSAPFVCATVNLLAALALAFVLRGGTEAVSSTADRVAHIEHHLVLWRGGWAVWMVAGISLVAFYAWWGAWLASTGWSFVALIAAMLGLASDLFAESLYIGWLPDRMENIAPAASLLTGGVANGLYTVAGILLTVRTRALRGWLRAWAWTIWAAGLALSVCAFADSVNGMMISTAVLMTLLCPWVTIFGWRLIRDSRPAYRPVKKS